MILYRSGHSILASVTSEARLLPTFPTTKTKAVKSPVLTSFEVGETGSDFTVAAFETSYCEKLSQNAVIISAIST